MTSGPDFPDPADSVGKTVVLRTSDLVNFHKNPREGDVDTIMGSLKTHGQFSPIVVNAGTITGRPYEVLAGNHVLIAIRQLREQNPFDNGWATTKCHIVDVDDDEANRIVLVDNQSFEQGEGYDHEMVLDLLKSVGTTGTGYSDVDMDDLEAAFNKTAPKVEPDDPDSTDDDPAPPDLTPPKEPSAIGYTIVFDDEEQQDLWFAFIKKIRADHPDLETVGERLLAHLAEHESERV